MSDFQSIATMMAAVLDDEAGSITPPIVQTSLFAFENYQAFEDRMAGRTNQSVYTRVQNPTVAAFEGLMAKAEGGEAAVGFASGIAAITSTLLAFVKPGSKIACVEHVYPDTYRFMEQILRPFGIEVSYYPVEDFEANADLLANFDIAYLESPSSVVFTPLNLALVAEHAKRHDTLTIIDNSWATPVFQNPLAQGIDIVVHSASKYISGHSDTVAGVTISSQEHIAAIRDLTLPLLGAKLAPFEAFLLTRGLRTLNARMMQHQATANLFVDRLAALPQVRKINSPGANAVPGLTGRSGLMSVEFDDSVDIPKFSDALSHFRLGVSWGGFESLILPARVGLAQAGPKNSMQAFGVSPNLVRLNLGLEDAEDLWADFEKALNQSAT
ncbi:MULTISPECIES: aminotransferase class I/II-fold pyridoxal phosphate-dependent enzyme [Halocynthiibacter]|uniref:Aminotransferase class I/II-fold pyridoxal phosphate-dependent enzyme n=1 Tax=Halocynthiibacter halioticoli TaxID=2986804 RepID=A0AAE3IVK1_9RHOB|nr:MULTISPECIES: aminotransferase class I/II-fold pyridoxal phosphate-dependent enzyme [Halocynthiibacter]MCV6822967.1 aminotransferase class I/II-fold pyridoxal phosphate-dependent enzyme [Halocynthiibacter halioticoli]MCW4055968.1 aminotransferase class I/II-fold pyridoxal phosphate-dependent enzyme [Halocynthiibacter sp. SDUM655004]